MHGLAGVMSALTVLFSFCKPLTFDASIIIIQHQLQLARKCSLAYYKPLILFYRHQLPTVLYLTPPAGRSNVQAQSSEGEDSPH